MELQTKNELQGFVRHRKDIGSKCRILSDISLSRTEGFSVGFDEGYEALFDVPKERLRDTMVSP